MELQSPKNLRYTLIIGAVETVLTTDPEGWSEESIARTRTADFGLNSEITVPLAFSGEAYDLLADLYYSKGQFALAYLKIEKSTNEWDYETFYQYRLDFSNCTDKLYQFEIAGIEEGLAVKFEKYKDTEYEVDLPTTNKIFIDYTGAKYTTTNQLQCNAGDIQQYQKENIVAGAADDAYALGATRAVRAYNNKLAFTDNEGLPYETMTFRALTSDTIDLIFDRNVTIEADAAVLQSTPASGTLQLIEHDASFGTPAVKKTYTATSSTTPANNRIDVFSGVETFQLAVQAGKLYTFFYIADEKSYDGINVLDGGKCYLDISNIVDSAYQNAKLEAFTYEWLIEQLLKKIDSNATLTSTITYPNVKELISATPCVYNIGNTTGTGKLKTTLKDVLESFHKLKCTYIDITGNVFTIGHLAGAYGTENNGAIECANIQLQHDTKHQYNKVKVGADTDKREDDDPLIYPFICEKEYSIENSLADAELDLVQNFMLDPYAIDKYIRETRAESDNKDECEFMVFATNPIMGTTEYANSGEYAEVVENSDNQPIQIQIGVTYDITSSIRKYDSKIKIYCDCLIIDRFTPIDFIIEVRENGLLIDNFTGNGTPSSLGYTTTNSIVKTSNVSINYIQNYDVQALTLSTTISVKSYSDFIYSEPKEISNSIYKDHTISGTVFKGDAATIYNIPLTPQRILDRWKEYLAISVVGSDTQALKFQTSTILNSGITSICGWETANVVEDTDLDLTDIEPTFLPATINADTYIDYDALFTDNPYGYYILRDKKTGVQIEGFVNKNTHSVGMNQTQQNEYQLKAITRS